MLEAIGREAAPNAHRPTKAGSASAAAAASGAAAAYLSLAADCAATSAAARPPAAAVIAHLEAIASAAPAEAGGLLRLI